MRRIAMTLLCALLFSVLCGTPAIAQVTDFSQRGRATGEMNSGGLGIAHPSLPLNSRAKVVNIITGKEIDVTIIGRIPVSSNRIADLSPEVWQELELVPGSEVRIYTAPAPRSRPVAETPPANPAPIAAETPPEPVPAQVASAPPPASSTATPPGEAEPAQALSQPVNITLNLTTIDAREVSRPVETPAATEPVTSPPATELVDTPPVQPQEQEVIQPAPAYEAQPAPTYQAQPAPTYQAQPAPTFQAQPTPVAAAEVLVIPGLPDPAADRVYRLQVGAFSAQESADRTARLVASLGFHVIWEQSGTLFRVYAIDVPAVLIESAAQRLGSVGIKEIWVRE